MTVSDVLHSTFTLERTYDRPPYSSTLRGGDHLATVSLTTVQFEAVGDGTRLTLTEQGAHLDGREDPSWREAGTNGWLDALGAELGA